MESPSLSSPSEFTPQLPEPPLESVPPVSSPVLFTRFKKVLFIGIGLLFLTALIGESYRFIHSLQTPAASPPALSPASPPASPSTSSRFLREGRISLPYLDSWLLLFSPLVDANSPETHTFYFARSLDEYRSLASCASTGSCVQAPLTLQISDPISVWPNSSLSDFIRQVKPELKLDLLTDSSLPGFENYSGYLDRDRLVYRSLIVIQPAPELRFQVLTASARSDTRDLLADYLDQLSRVVIADSAPAKSADLPNLHSYIAKFDARLQTTDYQVLMLILKNVLAPQDPARNPFYQLSTEGTNAYPPGNYLDYTYYLLTDNPDLGVGEYQFPQLSISLSAPASENFVSYLTDPKYCRVNTDCVYRANFCVFDAFNRYHIFRTPWGCGPGEYAGLGNGSELTESLGCRSNETITVEYDSLECLDNRCRVNNSRAVCR